MEGSPVDHRWADLPASEPRMLCDFATWSDDGSVGERGRYWWDSSQRWVVDLDGGPVIANTERGSMVRLRGAVTGGPPHGRMQRPAWRMLVPARSWIWGRPDDQWKPIGVHEAAGRGPCAPTSPPPAAASHCSIRSAPRRVGEQPG